MEQKTLKHTNMKTTILAVTIAILTILGMIFIPQIDNVYIRGLFAVMTAVLAAVLSIPVFNKMFK
ncbi:MAG: hypothetical protein IIZ78_06025 [Clostridiales bacterium]|nr:hypothetical protein [Clostridiales bacterium]